MSQFDGGRTRRGRIRYNTMSRMRRDTGETRRKAQAKHPSDLPYSRYTHNPQMGQGVAEANQKCHYYREEESPDRWNFLQGGDDTIIMLLITRATSCACECAYPVLTFRPPT